MQKAAASQARINDFLQVEPEIRNSATAAQDIKGRIAFKNVGLTYPDSGTRALEGVSFTLEPGQTLAVIGRTGGGKSTLAQLVARLYDPTDGVVEIDGKPVQEHHLSGLRAAIGYVPQDVFLFSDTIAANIAFGVDGAPAEPTSNRPPRTPVVHHNIMRLFPKPLRHPVWASGASTSAAGQKQRISIARAILQASRAS